MWGGEGAEEGSSTGRRDEGKGTSKKGSYSAKVTFAEMKKHTEVHEHEARNTPKKHTEGEMRRDEEMAVIFLF